MTDTNDNLPEVLRKALLNRFGSDIEVADLRKLSGGASRETWAFDAIDAAGGRHPLILKRDPVGAHVEDAAGVDAELGVDRLTEGRLFAAANAAGVPAPAVHALLPADANTSAGFVMDRIDGLVLGRHVLRDPALADARPRLARQCGEILAHLHAMPADTLPPLKTLDPSDLLQVYRDLLDRIGHPYPGFEYGLCWLDERREFWSGRRTPVHGDFRIGNLVIGPDGVRAVLDWELAHLGDPLFDLGWLCIPAWRYGEIDKPVGGVGDRADLLAGYAAAGGGQVSLEALHYWEAFGCLRWGMLCLIMGFAHLDGRQRSIEYAAIGRRTAETEHDLLALID